MISVQLLFAQPSGFIDQNADGKNDWFCDADGDGINDINQKSYAHSFHFSDINKDGLNDNYVDKDGDGVNDLKSKYSDENGDGWNDNIIDTDKNWINDITGLIYNRRSSGGDRFGWVLEESAFHIENYLDENQDGQYDNRRFIPRQNNTGGRDRFIDNDGDGVSDGRGFFRHRPEERGNPNRP